MVHFVFQASLMDVITESMQINVALLTAGFIGLTVSANREVQRIQNSTLLGAVAFSLLIYSSISIVITVSPCEHFPSVANLKQKWQLHADKGKKTALQKYSVAAMAAMALLWSLIGIVSTGIQSYQVRACADPVVVVSLGFLVNWKFKPGAETATPSPTAGNVDQVRFNVVVAVIAVFGSISILCAAITSVLVWIVKGK
jgi:hypothetical protein